MLHTLEAEVSQLSNEVSRLRLICNRLNENPSGARNGATPFSPGDGMMRDPLTVPMAVPNEPLAILPTIFQGKVGTKRLFKLLMEAYPWLTPDEVSTAREENQKKLDTFREFQQQQQEQLRAMPMPQQYQQPTGSAASLKKSEQPQPLVQPQPQKRIPEAVHNNSAPDSAITFATAGSALSTHTVKSSTSRVQDAPTESEAPFNAVVSELSPLNMRPRQRKHTAKHSSSSFIKGLLSRSKANDSSGNSSSDDAASKTASPAELPSTSPMSPTTASSKRTFDRDF